MLASLGPVVIAAVVALLTSPWRRRGTLYAVHLSAHSPRLMPCLVAHGAGGGPLRTAADVADDVSHGLFLRLKLSPPWQLALGGAIVGLLSLLTPKVWGCYSVVQAFLPRRRRR
jgi:CIC family chloride channel protein